MCKQLLQKKRIKTVKDYVCVDCQRIFIRNTNLKRHMKICKKKQTKPDQKILLTENKKSIEYVYLLTENKKSLEYVYVFKLREHILLHEDVYKIGLTTRTVSKRLSEYPKGSICYFSIDVPNCSITEREIINKFCEEFKQRKDIGTEYFEGPILKMIETINFIL
jgi:hypothetical protein